MPLYEFCCATCGLFDQWRSMSESSAPAYCPSCQQPGKRIFSPPAVKLSGSLRLKQETREPRLVTQDSEPVTPTFKSHNGGRPWMISH